jgi:ribose-phosphate pyrophosphokinase
VNLLDSVIVSGPGSEQIGRSIARLLKIDNLSIYSRTFPDGETYVRLPEGLESKDVVLIHSTGPPQNERLVQLFLLLDTLKDMKIKTFHLVIPYLAYARQDRRQKIGEPISALTIMKLIESLSVSELITVNVHNPKIFQGLKTRVIDQSAIPLMADYFKEQGFEGAFSFSLGKKMIDLERAKTAAKILDGPYGHLKTFRDPNSGVVTLEKSSLNIRGKDAIIFDDVVTTGRTHIKIINELKRQGAEKVYLACVHSLISEEAQELLLRVVEDFVCTDTVLNRFSKISVAPLIAKAIIGALS